VISFVVIVRDEPPLILQRTIDGLLATSGAYAREVVVVDDGSRVPVINDQDVRVVRHDVPVGVCRARRSGAAAAEGDVIVWLDSHMTFASGWLEAMVAHVGSGSLLCAAWSDYATLEPLCWGATFSWCHERDYARSLSPGICFQHRLVAPVPGSGAADVPVAIGACYMMLRSAYDAIGGFSPYFGIWGKAEEDISARAWILGKGVKCVTDAHVGHWSRPRLPYPVSWAGVELNQALIIRSIFGERVADAAERTLEPLPESARRGLAEIDLTGWRERIRAGRRMSDREFLDRFLPDAPSAVLAAT
jgi:polypeptide N-acetylgalactosaminyltransferase